MEFLEKNMVMRDEFNYFKKNTESRLDNLEWRVNHVESQMVTKNYLDDRLADFAVKINQKIRECLCRT